MVPLNRVSELMSPPAVIRCLQNMVFAQGNSTTQASPLSVVLVNQVLLYDTRLSYSTHDKTMKSKFVARRATTAAIFFSNGQIAYQFDLFFSFA